MMIYLQNDEVDALIDSYGGTGKNRLKRHEALQILSSEGRETEIDGGGIASVSNKEKNNLAIKQVEKKSPKDPMKTDIWTVDPRTGKEVGVITNAQRRNLELYLQKQNKEPERSPGLYIQSST